MANASLDGLLTGLSLIVAIGAQNAFLLRQGLRRVRVGAIVAVCTLSDFVLIIAGVSGIGAVVQHAGWALVLVRCIGVAFLTWYGLSSVWRARHRSALTAAPDGPRSRGALLAPGGTTPPSPPEGAALAPGGTTPPSPPEGAALAPGGTTPPSPPEGAVVRRAMAFTWLNPHVYLDTVVLLGSVANAHGPSGRWWFAVGAGAASALWFSGLGFGARLAAPLLATARAWQVLDLLIGVTMVLLAVKLAVA